MARSGRRHQGKDDPAGPLDIVPHPELERDGPGQPLGYYFTLLLPRPDGTSIICDDNPADLASVDSDLAETTWCCIANPVNHGNGGRYTFVVNQTGDISATEDHDYDGSGLPLDPGAAFVTSLADSITGRLAVGTTGHDGNMWRQVQ